jgi:hypothetical protein
MAQVLGSKWLEHDRVKKRSVRWRERRNQNEFLTRIYLPQSRQQLLTVHSGHPQVGEHNIKPPVLAPSQCLFAGVGRLNDVIRPKPLPAATSISLARSDSTS